MALSRSLRADFLLVDDQRARKVAQLNGIPILGSLGVLLRAKELGLLKEIRPSIDRIREVGLFYAESLVQELLRLAGE
jgi:predicted nucleic acid-binding protein